MADEQEPSGPSLEPPSLFRRKKKAAPAPQPADGPVAPPVATPVVPPVAPTPPVDETPTTILDDVTPAAPTRPLASSDGEWSSGPPETSQNPSLDVAPRPPRVPRTGPLVPGKVAAAVAGLMVGAVIVGLTAASFELCSSLRGTSSCGGPGFFLLIAILVVAVVLGAAVLRLCRVPEPGSTSFLAVGLTSVVALLFLIDELFEWWMIIVIPLVSVATYVLSHWVTATFVEPAKPVGVVDDPEVVDHDVR